MSRYAKRTDSSHSEIRDGLRAEGWDVADMSAVGGGIPDLFVMILKSPRGGRSLGLEVKCPSIRDKMKALTVDQQVYFHYHGETTRVVQSLEEAHMACVEAAKAWRV